MASEKITEKDVLKIAEDINKENFSGLKGLSVGHAMYYIILLKEVYGQAGITFKSCVKQLLKITVLKYVDAQNNYKTANKAFLFSNSYWSRVDHKKLYDKVVALTTNSTEFVHTRKISLRNLHNIYRIFQWYSIFKRYFNENAWYYTFQLAFSFADFDFIRHKLAKSKIKLLTVLCDVHCIDSLVVQHCNSIGIKTATLQHGNLAKGTGYSLSKSTYFLGYGQYTKELALESGMDEKHFVAVGMPQFIGKEINDSLIIHDTKKIGCVFCSYETIEDDTRMLNTVLDYAEKHGYEVCVKLHPASPKNCYPNINWERVKEIYGKEINVYQFMEKIDFATVGFSTVFIEYVMELFPCFSFKCNNDKYEKINWNKFHDLETMENCVQLFETDKRGFEQKLKETRDYFSPSSDIAEKYKSFYSKFDE